MRKLLLLFLFFVPTMVFAVTATTSKVSYELPYPGLLPDSPLYFVKQVRDWVMDKLVTDPVKKAEFYIRQGDKRLNMGVFLAQKGKAALAESTISKGEKYMNNAVQVLLWVKSQGREIPGPLLDILTRSLAKHAEVLEEQIQSTTDAAIKGGLTASLTLVTQLQNDLAKLTQ